MKTELLLRAILPDVLINNFDIVSFEKKPDRFDIFLDEKKVQLKEDKTNPDIIPMALVSIVLFRTIQSGDVLPIFMSANVNGLTSHPMRSSVATGICLNLREHGSMQSSCLF